MSNQLRRCSDCNFPLGNREKFCPRCGARQPREPGLPEIATVTAQGLSKVAKAANVKAE